MINGMNVPGWMEESKADRGQIHGNGETSETTTLALSLHSDVVSVWEAAKSGKSGAKHWHGSRRKCS
jgi:hypothetical protein